MKIMSWEKLVQMSLQKYRTYSGKKIDKINEKIADVENDRKKRKKELEDKVGILKSMYRINAKNHWIKVCYRH